MKDKTDLDTEIVMRRLWLRLNPMLNDKYPNRVRYRMKGRTATIKRDEYEYLRTKLIELGVIKDD